MQARQFVFDISWFVIDKYILKDDSALETWCSLLEMYSERFIFGTDIVGHWSNYVPTVRKYDKLYSYLSEKARKNIWRNNIYKLISKE